MPETLKAISLWQPWASLWLSRHKRHETRHWATRHRGKLLVHAAKHFERDVDRDLAELLKDEFGRDWARDLPTGALLGIVDLEDCIATEELRPVDPERMADDAISDLVCGDFGDGRFGWRRGPTFIRFRDPVPYRGYQGLFNVPWADIAEAMNTVVKIELDADVELDI